MSEPHLCHASGCNVRVPPRLFMCRRHWYMLSKKLRDQIWRHYREGQEIDKRPSAAYLVAAQAAISWLEWHEEQLAKGVQ